MKFEWTQQEIFDHVLTAMRKQGHQAMGTDAYGGAACVYRASDGAACAVGCLIPDDVYDSSIEGCVLRYLDGMLTSERAMVSTLRELGLFDHRALLADMQDAHDQLDSETKITDLKNEVWLAEFERRMQKIAHRYMLHYSVV